MKRIEFIPGILAMRGNMSGKQVLQYASNDNPAFDAPEGRQYAKNYTPRYIGAKRAKDGLTYFSVKTKSATLINTASKRRMALLGAAGACVAYILKPGNMSVVNVLAPLNLHYEHAKSAEGFTGTLRKYVFETVYAALAAGTDFVWPAVQLSPQTTIPAVTLYSRWSGTAIESENLVVNVSDDILVKFWKYLVMGGAEFTIAKGYDGEQGLVIEEVVTGVMKQGQTFGQLIEGSANIIGLSLDDQDNVEMAGTPVWINFGAEGANAATVIVADKQYIAATQG